MVIILPDRAQRGARADTAGTAVAPQISRKYQLS
jgi:hypothetical protein